ncbi:hypothetical protein [Bradyrhizobium sp. 76]|uniref:hypothetical protein n=1 Tax=Bradyrhizobium sp. 76 TaxID=2782680 RepID=UPI001FFA9421|nr:hypothetical protein [Bradyrhizobium sp. 76]MCK1404987.1 hypothetical protein [Bradyrhizobium sp. 76]
MLVIAEFPSAAISLEESCSNVSYAKQPFRRLRRKKLGRLSIVLLVICADLLLATTAWMIIAFVWGKQT